MAHLDYLDEGITTLNARVEELLAPFRGGADAPRHPPRRGPADRREPHRRDRGGHASLPQRSPSASWAGLCPGNNESAGKHKAGKTGKGNRWLRATLTEAALGAIRTKDSALAARYRRMTHRGHNRAVTAVAHALLRMAYQVPAQRVPYQDPGPDYFDRRHTARATRRAVQLLERQGHRVTLEPAA